MTHARGGAADRPTGPTHHDLPGSEVPEGALEPAELRAGDVRPGAEEVAPVRPAPSRPASPKIKRTRVSGTWVAVIAGLAVLIVLLIFILQNLDSVTVHFFGAEGSLPLAIAMLFSAIGGAALVALIGGARIMQLRKQARRR
ncbi:lipopolysaccharide assembly protein LapA domain-containing protein [Amycolatopsis sp. FBCC-B4732]|uniref:LapA family protein n=1 Tax=Amycolatopsis sp. FBCC-B4732 TaxID=3079339 RepID=UPI001FF4A8F0|nr:lipopolysaccharide assembly protein LapA domain-containing protein [Amycolatopsis sp. FBCC-B4732]UOX87960.1 lipopolysaccharide assembly protein LapA domain-containing protein [Amycolatopsis sp. FBCC-B4732]